MEIMRNKLSPEAAFELKFFEKHGVWLSQLEDDEREEYLNDSSLKPPSSIVSEDSSYLF